MKLTVIGGGGVRSPFLAKSIACHADKINLTEICFLDIDENHLNTYGKIAKHVFKHLKPAIKFTLTTDKLLALRDADYVITTIRVGGENGRVQDELIALKHKVLGQETTGVGGFAMASRSIPAILEYCKLIEQVSSPNVILFNFTNPSGLVTEAIIKSGFSRQVFGICDAPTEFIREVARMIDCSYDELSMDCYGLNHLSWFPTFQRKNQDITQQILSDSRLYEQTSMKYFEPELTHLLSDQFSNEYLYFYFYSDVALQAILHSKQTRGEQIKAINERMFAKLKQMNAKVDIDTDIDNAFTVFYSHYLERENSYMKSESAKDKSIQKPLISFKEFLAVPDDSGYAGVAVDIIQALKGEQARRVIVSVKNDGALDFLYDDDVVEISCLASKNGIKPVRYKDIPDTQKNLISKVKEYERLAVEAILHQDKQKAIKALMVHPLINSYSIAKALIDDYNLFLETK